MLTAAIQKDYTCLLYPIKILKSLKFPFMEFRNRIYQFF